MNDEEMKERCSEKGELVTISLFSVCDVGGFYLLRPQHVPLNIIHTLS